MLWQGVGAVHMEEGREGRLPLGRLLIPPQPLSHCPPSPHAGRNRVL